MCRWRWSSRTSAVAGGAGLRVSVVGGGVALRAVGVVEVRLAPALEQRVVAGQPERVPRARADDAVRGQAVRALERDARPTWCRGRTCRRPRRAGGAGASGSRPGCASGGPERHACSCGGGGAWRGGAWSRWHAWSLTRCSTGWWPGDRRARCHVAGPTTPSAVRPWARWNALTALIVAGPNAPSPGSPSARCSAERRRRGRGRAPARRPWSARNRSRPARRGDVRDDDACDATRELRRRPYLRQFLLLAGFLAGRKTAHPVVRCAGRRSPAIDAREVQGFP